MLSTVNLYALGGNHLVQAMKMVLDQNPGNDNYSCLRAIEVEVFCGLTNLEARFVGSAHNKKCNTLKPTFQDKVKNSRGIYEVYANSSEVSWKEACARSLGLLDGKEINKDGIPVILSVASYSSVNYSHVMEIFSQFTRNSPMGTSIRK
ncbi:uncharacterized protein LOC128553407 [Mercenaria mercenaria]|uniref:uncharacterized protein LOC128553407 n=1 Tax=Mercenaria mercenaria TaxID=6596 RepID=UPI00234FB583|nr:uncharacterized protein LOC128553407 [Mercenaria mercenaria]